MHYNGIGKDRARKGKGKKSKNLKQVFSYLELFFQHKKGLKKKKNIRVWGKKGKKRALGFFKKI